jgi:two-component system, LuxR family, sensor kinase FixL
MEMPRGRRAFVTMDLAILIILAVFATDILTNLRGAIAVLYIAVPLLLASAYSARVVIFSAAFCAALTAIAFFHQHLGEEVDSAYTRFAVSIAALAVTTFLTLRQKRSAAERERSERRYGAIFHAAGFAAWESDWSEVRTSTRLLFACLMQRPQRI